MPACRRGTADPRSNGAHERHGEGPGARRLRRERARAARAARAAGGAARRPARDAGAAHPPAAAALAHRRLVLRRPLRPGRPVGARRHARARPPAHRARDRHLALRGRGGAPRHDRRRGRRAARRGEPDDRGARRRALRVLDCPARPSCTARSCGSRCPTPRSTARAASSTRCRRRARSRGAEVRVFVGDWLGSTGAPQAPTPLIGAEVRLPSGLRWEAAVDPAHEVGVLVDLGEVEVEGAARDPVPPRRPVARPPHARDRGGRGGRAGARARGGAVPRPDHDVVELRRPRPRRDRRRARRRGRRRSSSSARPAARTAASVRTRRRGRTCCPRPSCRPSG